MTAPLTPSQFQALLDGPAATPPPGITPNFDDPPNLNAAFIGTVVVCLSLSTALILMRFYTRLYIIRKRDPSDITCLLCFFAFIGLTGIFAKFVDIGGGRHTWDFRVKDAVDATYWFLMAAMSYDICMILIKVSILIQYRMIFVPAKKTSFMWWSTWLLTAVIIIFYITGGLIQIFFCNPVQRTWNPLVLGTCLDSSPGRLNIISSSFNIAIDVILLALPLIAISRLHLAKKRRLGIGSVFLVGLFACISAALRLYYSYLLAASPDSLYYAMKLALWAYAETTSGIVVACMPVIPRFIQKTVRESMLYIRITSSLRSLISFQSRGSQARDYDSVSGQNLSSRYDPRGTRTGASGSDGSFKAAGSIETGLEELELKDQGRPFEGHGILRTVDIQTSRR